MRCADARLLLHRGHGPTHLDLVLGGGAALATLQLTPDGHGWSARWLPPHRRRYLAWSGPVAGGRGTVRGVWRGTARWARADGGWRIALGDGTRLAMRRDRALIIGDARWRRWHG